MAAVVSAAETSPSEKPLFGFCLRLADTALVLGHRLSEWSHKAHTLEEDIALSNLGLDLIGQARNFYQYAAEVEGAGRDEDQLAYLRDAGDWRNPLIVELPNGDFAFTMMRHFLYSAWYLPFIQALMKSSDERLSAIAAKTEKEMKYHLRHASEWIIRLADGTEESRRRIDDALAAIWPHTAEMFEMTDAEKALLDDGISINHSGLKTAFDKTVADVFGEATLSVPETGFQHTGGLGGRHTEHLGYLLADLQFLQRAYPGATW